MYRKMLLGDPPSIQITAQDLIRLKALLENLDIATSKDTLEFLRSEVERARLVDEAEVAKPFVQLGSCVLFWDEQGKTFRFTLALPGQKSHRLGTISVVTPVGAALLGLSEGQSISYEAPGKHIKTVTVLKVSPAPTTA